MVETKPPNRFFGGLDLGQAADFSALAIAEVIRREGARPQYDIRELHRWDRGTPYPQVAREVKERLGLSELRRLVLAVDYTGVGRPVVDLLREARLPVRAMWAVAITAGGTVVQDGPKGELHVPKRDLVGAVRVLQQERRLKVAPKLVHAVTLLTELRNFQVRITDSGRDQYGAWREGTHDDLVLAVAMAVWLGEWYGPTVDQGCLTVAGKPGLGQTVQERARALRIAREKAGG